jgi:two-component sensor histidine kinase
VNVRLAGIVAASLALALHESTPNAIKFGALSTSHGHLSVRWNVDSHDPRRVRLECRSAGYR